MCCIYLHFIFPEIDVLVNNGGRSQRSLFVDTNLDVFSAIMELNYLGTISLTKHVLNHMIERRRGKIVTVSSVMGIMGAPLASGYCASKHALQVCHILTFIKSCCVKDQRVDSFSSF